MDFYFLLLHQQQLVHHHYTTKDYCLADNEDPLGFFMLAPSPGEFPPLMICKTAYFLYLESSDPAEVTGPVKIFCSQNCYSSIGSIFFLTVP
jgi:hypothetical protein